MRVTCGNNHYNILNIVIVFGNNHYNIPNIVLVLGDNHYNIPNIVLVLGDNHYNIPNIVLVLGDNHYFVSTTLNDRHIIISLIHHLTTSPHHHFTTSPHHHITTSPHDNNRFNCPQNYSVRQAIAKNTPLAFQRAAHCVYQWLFRFATSGAYQYPNIGSRLWHAPYCGLKHRCLD